MQDRQTDALKAQYQKVVIGEARKIYLKAQEVTRDINESPIREEDRNEIRLQVIKMLTTKPTQINQKP
jgi:hypothetical protein